ILLHSHMYLVEFCMSILMIQQLHLSKYFHQSMTSAAAVPKFVPVISIVVPPSGGTCAGVISVTVGAVVLETWMNAEPSTSGSLGVDEPAIDTIIACEPDDAAGGQVAITSVSELH